MTTRPEDLLAAYADDALEPDERAEVERYLAEHPDADAEVEALRDTLNQVRAAQPRPAAEPAWGAMADAVRAAIAPPVVPLHRRLVRPRVLAPLVAAAAAAVLAVWWTRAPDRVAEAPSAPAPAALAATDHGPDLRADEVVSLDDDELDILYGALDPAELIEGDELAIDPVLDPALVADWTDDDHTTSDDGFDLFAEPDYGGWVDSLTADELRAVDAYLADQSG